MASGITQRTLKVTVSEQTQGPQLLLHRDATGFANSRVIRCGMNSRPTGTVPNLSMHLPEQLCQPFNIEIVRIPFTFSLLRTCISFLGLVSILIRDCRASITPRKRLFCCSVAHR